MKRLLVEVTLVGVLLTLAHPALAQNPRLDFIWARVTNDPITLDGVMNEPAWAQAESMIVDWHVDNGVPGSGWKLESGVPVSFDPTHATFKFLAQGNIVYMGARIPDKSIGGSVNFNRFDGLLMAIKDHLDPAHPKPPSEYFYAWWWEDSGVPDPQPAGQLPAFIGRWANRPIGSPRTAEQIDAWDAATVVNGISNDDASGDDVGYTIEMKFNLTPMGYDITTAQGDAVEWNVTVYDTDWYWFPDGTYSPGSTLDPNRFIVTRSWWQSPWGNAAWYNEVRILSKPDVTTTSGAVPSLTQDVTIHEITSAAITVDGQLNEPAWTDPNVYSFDIRWDDDVLRATYPATGPYRAGQYQPTVNGGTATVRDPCDVTVKMFTKGDMLYMGYDARDHFVQSITAFDRWDGFITTINSYTERGADNNLAGKRLTFRLDDVGNAVPEDDLNSLVTGGKAQVAVHLMTGTTVDTLYTPDNGYSAEMAVDLTGLGYPTGLGDRTLWLGVNALDGDSFSAPLSPTDSYGTRTWWFRQYPDECCPAVVYMQPASIAADPIGLDQGLMGLARSYPSPSIRPTIEYSLAARSVVSLEVYDVRGRLVDRQMVGPQNSGVNTFVYDGSALAAGVYFYRVLMLDPESGALRASANGKMVLVK